MADGLSTRKSESVLRLGRRQVGRGPAAGQVRAARPRAAVVSAFQAGIVRPWSGAPTHRLLLWRVIRWRPLLQHQARYLQRCGAVGPRPRGFGLAPRAGRGAPAPHRPAPHLARAGHLPPVRRRRRPCGTRPGPGALVPARAPPRGHGVDRRDSRRLRAWPAARPDLHEAGPDDRLGWTGVPARAGGQFQWCRDQFPPSLVRSSSRCLPRSWRPALTVFASSSTPRSPPPPSPRCMPPPCGTEPLWWSGEGPTTHAVLRAGAPGPRRHGVAGAPPGGPDPRRRTGQPARAGSSSSPRRSSRSSTSGSKPRTCSMSP